MRGNFLIVLFFILVLVAGCSNGSERSWYATENEAIEEGLLQSGGSEIQRLTVDNETIVLYKLNDAGAIGVGSVTTSEEGYSWYQGMTPFKARFVQFDYIPESKKNISLTIGKVNNETMKDDILEGILKQNHLKVVKGYFIGANMRLSTFYNSKLLE